MNSLHHVMLADPSSSKAQVLKYGSFTSSNTTPIGDKLQSLQIQLSIDKSNFSGRRCRLPIPIKLNPERRRFPRVVRCLLSVEEPNLKTSERDLLAIHCTRGQTKKQNGVRKMPTIRSCIRFSVRSPLEVDEFRCKVVMSAKMKMKLGNGTGVVRKCCQECGRTLASPQRQMQTSSLSSRL